MRRLLAGILMLVLSTVSAVASESDGLILHRSIQNFPEAMLALQTSIGEHGYTVSRVQRVDIGLTKSGYKTDKYRIVFFGKSSEIRAVKQSQPQLIPYLPLKVVIFSENNETLLVASNMTQFSELVNNEYTKTLLQRWNNDIQSIFSEIK
ncbi:MAG: hypothetical protein KAT25_09210 [Sulfuriflexus sp.]|nr:hypothetical protein [Sulfuriflexus sp.]